MENDYRAAAKKRAKERTASIWYKLSVGDNTFRILPTPVTKRNPYPWYEYAIHRNVGPKKRTVRCGKDPNTNEGDCWLCDVQLPKLKKSGHEKRVEALKSKPQFAVQICSVSEDGDFDGPFIFTPSKKVADQILNSVFGARKRNYLDPKKGYNLTLNRTGTGMLDTVYGMLEPDDEPSAVPVAIIKKLKPFSELKEIPVYDEANQKAVYQGVDTIDDEDEDDDDEDEDTPKAKNKSKKPPVEDDEEDEDEPKPKKKKKSVDEEDEEEAESEDESDDDDEDEEPPSKSKGKKKPPVEDEDEEEDEEDEDEDEKPAPKKKGKKKPADEDEEDEPDDLDEDDLDEPAKKKAKKKPAEDEDADEEDEDEDEKPPAKTKKKKPPVEEDEEEDEDEDEAPPPKKKKAK